MKKFYIGMAARFVDDKLQDFLVDIFNENKEFFKENKCILELAGNGETLKNIKKKIQFYKLENQIFLKGNLREDKIIQWFKTLDIYIHISKDETSSTSILQAMSIGIPIIASNVGGNKMLLKKDHNKKNILLINNDKSKIFKSLKHLILNKKIRMQMSRFSRKIAIKNFSCSNMFDLYEKLFTKT